MYNEYNRAIYNSIDIWLILYFFSMKTSYFFIKYKKSDVSIIICINNDAFWTIENIQIDVPIYAAHVPYTVFEYTSCTDSQQAHLPRCPHVGWWSFQRHPRQSYIHILAAVPYKSQTATTLSSIDPETSPEPPVSTPSYKVYCAMFIQRIFLAFPLEFVFSFQMRSFGSAVIYCCVLSFAAESISGNPLVGEAHHPFNTQYHSQGSQGQYKWAKFNIKYSYEALYFAAANDVFWSP